MDAPAADSAARDAAPPNQTVQNTRLGFGTFGVFSVGLFVLLVAYFMSIRFLEDALDQEIQERVDRAIIVSDFDRPLIQQMKERIDAAVRDSRWVRIGGLRVTTLVLAQDGVTWLYVDGRGGRISPEGLAPIDMIAEWMEYLPATAEVTVTLPHSALLSNGILITFTVIMLQFAYLASRRQSGHESQRLNDALQIRDRAARRTQEIESELAETRSRLSEIEPIEREHSDEIDALQRERESLHQVLANLAAREESLRGRAERAVDLAQEVRALEDLLEEATGDLESKDGEIGRLEQSLKKASRSSDKAANTRTKAAEVIARRFRTLYKTLEVDDRAINDITSLGDESLRLKAEESVKRLAEEADNVSVRRKVGGLPSYVQVYELGFAGKGRIYYTRGKSRRFRILLVGAKNTQPTDLEYLSRLPKDDFS
jgi:DNA repair exonuclease SbcCD ATPase subunit